MVAMSALQRVGAFVRPFSQASASKFVTVEGIGARTVIRNHIGCAGSNIGLGRASSIAWKAEGQAD